jgi:predicted transposase/invertase (TIGR01784 family)
MTKEDREEMLEDIQRFCLMDDTFFHTCLKDSPSGMEWILRVILDDPELVVLEMHTQEDVPNVYGREVVFDVFVRDAKGKEYDVEVQRDNAGADPRRARANASLMDTMNIEKGKKWKDIPPAIVIFITEHDPLKGGKPIYHVRRTIEELDNKRFEDDAAIIYVNASIQNDDTPLGLLMQDFACKDPEKMHSKILAERARYFKSDEHGVMNMCKIMEEFAKKYAKGEREEGVAIGRAAGVAEKTMRTILNQLKRHADYEIIASDNETSVDEVIRIAKENGLAY